MLITSQGLQFAGIAVQMSRRLFSRIGPFKPPNNPLDALAGGAWAPAQYC